MCNLCGISHGDGVIWQESRGHGSNPVVLGRGTGFEIVFARGWDDPIPMNAQPWVVHM